MTPYVYIGAALAATVLIYGVVTYKRDRVYPIIRKMIALMIIFYGGYLATLTGSYTALVVPGIGSIALGAGVGAGVGIGTWLVLGTVGVATGGIGFAVGAGTMLVIGALLGGIGGAAGGFGLKTVTYPLVSPIFWVPVIIIGILFFRGRKIKKQKPSLLPLIKNEDSS